MKCFIIEKYDGGPLAAYQGDWKRYFKMGVKILEYKVLQDNFDKDLWKEIRDEIQKLKNLNKLTPRSSLSFQKELNLRFVPGASA
jgi:hypothetical protein